jgi:hypothetical protein
VDEPHLLVCDFELVHNFPEFIQLGV